jgi:Signal transduction histidine kinase regulating citrate/malate metabolism
LKKKLNPGKTVITIFALYLLEIALTATILLLFGINDGRLSLITTPWFVLLFIVILTSVIINSVLALGNRTSILRKGHQLQFLQDTLSKLENLNTTLRAQRHDFMNQLQVVYSLIEMDEYKEAREYIEKVYNDIQKVSKVMKTANPAINALLQAKLINCDKKGISVDLIVTTQLKDLKIPSWEFCRVLGNLLDNAIYSLEQKGSDMLLKIELYEDLKAYYLRVTDNGTSIPVNLRVKIFEPGFTTKGKMGEGMGLAISRDIMEQYAGSIDIGNDPEITIFEVRCPKQIDKSQE